MCQPQFLEHDLLFSIHQATLYLFRVPKLVDLSEFDILPNLLTKLFLIHIFGFLYKNNHSSIFHIYKSQFIILSYYPTYILKDLLFYSFL